MSLGWSKLNKSLNRLCLVIQLIFNFSKFDLTTTILQLLIINLTYIECFLFTRHCFKSLYILTYLILTITHKNEEAGAQKS